MFSNHEIVPVVMFHSVGLNDTDWVFSHISEPLESFIQKLELLRKKGYQFLFWSELYDHMAGLKKAPKKSIMITFDDGYLDNWVYVFPVLKKLGVKATIFVTPEFVDPRSGIRPNWEDVTNGKVAKSELNSAGFLNWDEMSAMESSGLVDIQSHCLTHTWYYASPTVTDFHRPENREYPWLVWNAFPERKPYYMVEDQSGLVPAGTPVYEFEKSLVCRRYYPPEDILREMAVFVDDSGGPSFFQKEGWRKRLMTLHRKLFEKYGAKGRRETDYEYKKRVFFELTESKRMIEQKLQKRVDYICWPGGAYNSTVLKLAGEAGYKAWTLSSRDQTSFRNLPGVSPKQVKRVGSFSWYNIPGKRSVGRASAIYFLCGIERHKGSFVYTWIGRALVAGIYIWHTLEERLK